MLKNKQIEHNLKMIKTEFAEYKQDQGAIYAELEKEKSEVLKLQEMFKAKERCKLYTNKTLYSGDYFSRTY